MRGLRMIPVTAADLGNDAASVERLVNTLGMPMVSTATKVTRAKLLLGVAPELLTPVIPELTAIALNTRGTLYVFPAVVRAIKAENSPVGAAALSRLGVS